MFGTKKKYTQNMTNVETLPTRKFEMSKLKLIIAGLSLRFQIDGVGGDRRVEALEKGWEKGGWEGDILRLREP